MQFNCEGTLGAHGSLMQIAADGDGLAGLVASGSCLGVLATDQVMGGYGLLGDGRTTWRRVDCMLDTFGCWS